MEIIKKRIADMERAEYNPRVELMPGDDEYEKLKRNIDRFGVVVPVIWNKRTNRVVSGHQRLTVLMNEGVTETDVSVVDLDETAEKQLNIAMNKVTGEWDEVKLKELLDGLGDAAPETGFDLYEIEALENNVDALVDGDFLDSELKVRFNGLQMREPDYSLQPACAFRHLSRLLTRLPVLLRTEEERH